MSGVTSSAQPHTTDPHQFEAAVDALREAQMVERLAQLRMSRARVAAIGRARKLHVAEMDAHPYDDGGIEILFKIENALSTAQALHKEQQKLLTAPCNDPLLLLAEPPPALLTESRIKKRDRDRRRLASQRLKLVSDAEAA